MSPEVLETSCDAESPGLTPTEKDMFALVNAVYKAVGEIPYFEDTEVEAEANGWEVTVKVHYVIEDIPGTDTTPPDWRLDKIEYRVQALYAVSADADAPYAARRELETRLNA